MLTRCLLRLKNESAGMRCRSEARGGRYGSSDYRWVADWQSLQSGLITCWNIWIDKREDYVLVLCGHKISLYTGRPSGQRMEDCPRAGAWGLSHIRTPPHLWPPPHLRTPSYSDRKKGISQFWGGDNDFSGETHKHQHTHSLPCTLNIGTRWLPLCGGLTDVLAGCGYIIL